jgi:hypothetical protein
MSHEHNLDSVLKQMAEDHHPELPSPGLIWWRAQILRKQREKERIEQPLIIMRGVAGVVCSVAFVVLLVGNWSLFRTATTDGYGWLLPLAILALTISLVSMVAFLRSPASKA